MKKDKLWEAALGQLELSVSQGNFLTWFQSTRIKEKKGGKVIIETPSAFTYEWLSKKYREPLLEILKGLDKSVKELDFCIKSYSSTQHKPLKKNFHILARKIVKSSVGGKGANGAADLNTVKQPKSGLAKTLNPKYVFDTFVVGTSNEIAHAACQAVSEKPGEAYNPLFICGGVGLGKTHLLQAVGNAILSRNEEARVLFVSSEKFINDFVQSIRERTTQSFKRRYREVDVLMIDDIQFLAGKSKTQEELFHTFNALQGQNGQVVLTSDRSPRAIPTLEERLRSRLGGGMIAEIQQPDYETRLAIITEKVKRQNKSMVVSEEAQAYIAKNIQKNVRELEGALNQVIAHCELSNSQATLDYVKKILEGVLEKPQQKIVDSKALIKLVSTYYALSLDDICGKSRKKEIVRPRQIAMYLLRKENSVSFPTIGDYFGGRDHTTAMHACDKIEKLLEHNDDLLKEINFIRERLYA